MTFQVIWALLVSALLIGFLKATKPFRVYAFFLGLSSLVSIYFLFIGLSLVAVLNILLAIWVIATAWYSDRFIFESGSSSSRFGQKKWFFGFIFAVALILMRCFYVLFSENFSQGKPPISSVQVGSDMMQNHPLLLLLFIGVLSAFVLGFEALLKKESS